MAKRWKATWISGTDMEFIILMQVIANWFDVNNSCESWWIVRDSSESFASYSRGQRIPTPYKISCTFICTRRVFFFSFIQREERETFFRNENKFCGTFNSFQKIHGLNPMPTTFSALCSPFVWIPCSDVSATDSTAIMKYEKLKRRSVVATLSVSSFRS